MIHFMDFYCYLQENCMVKDEFRYIYMVEEITRVIWESRTAKQEEGPNN